MPKSMLAVLTGLSGDRAVMEAAIAAARTDGGHVTCLHGRIDTLGAAAMFEASFPQGRGDPGLVRHIGQEDAARTAHARDAFDAAAKQHGLAVRDAPGGDVPGAEGSISLSWMETRSIFDETLEEARYHELVVMARELELSGEAIRSVLMQSGRPVLLAPPNRTPKIGRNIALAWKASAEAARAVTAAASFLARAERVFILTVSHNEAGDNRDRVSAERLAASLGWQGVQAEVEVQYGPPGKEGAALQAMACDRECDLLVMGAYGHSRLREYVLGGVTESMLEACVLPVLMFR